MKNIKLNGISVTDYEGQGSPLIFIHAYPLCNRMWDEQVNYFKDKYRVVTYDIRGLGYSNDFSNAEDYLFTMEELVNDLFNIIDELKLGKVNACGLSIGGYILLRALVREQSRFSSVILADTKSENDDNIGLLSRSQFIINLKDLKNDKKETAINELIKNLISEEGYKNEKLRTFIEMIIGWMDVKGLAAVMIAIATRTNTFYELKNIETNTLMIVGKEDKITPPVKSFFMRENIKNSIMKIIPGAGHLSNLEAPDEFNKAIEEFLLNVK
ncbi:MAG: alpha/beta hydrolase [Ignavibacteria bacterium]|nr:alpha/beta hydrolase [Ignavibacteria bacterium]